jgi:hypothetical protein
MDDLFCPNCGARQSSTGARFCYRCGQPLVLPDDPEQSISLDDETAAAAGGAAVGSRVEWPGASPSRPVNRGAGYTSPETTGAGGPPRGIPQNVSVYETPPRRDNWLLPAGLLLAALLGFLAWRGVQAVVGPTQPVWTPGATAQVGGPVAGVTGTMTPEVPISRARPPTATLPPTIAASPTAPLTATAAPAETPAPGAPPATATVSQIATVLRSATQTAVPASPTAVPTATTGAPTPGGALTGASGRLIAYVSEESGRPQIHVVQADGRNGQQLTTEGANRSPAWAPDNSALYYVSERGDRSGIYRFDLATGREDPVALGTGLGRPQPVAGVALSARQQVGGGYRLILADRTIFELNRPFDYHWLPDGSQVLIDPLSDPREIYKVNLADGNVTTVTPQRSWNASWGPGGEVLFVSNNPGVAFVFVSDNNGDNVRRVSPEDKWAQAPAWSPDGQWIAYVAGDGPAWNLYRMNTNGEGPTRLAEAANPAKSPSWEPGSGRLVLESNARSNWDIVVVDLQGNAQTVAGAAADEYDPAWSN